MDTNVKNDTAFKFFVLCCAIVAMVGTIMIAISQQRLAVGWGQLAPMYGKMGERNARTAAENRVLATTTSTWISGGAGQGTTTMLYPDQDIEQWEELHARLLTTNLASRPPDHAAK